MIVLGLAILGIVLVVFLVIAWRLISSAGKAGQPGKAATAKQEFNEAGGTIFALAFALILMAGAALHH